MPALFATLLLLFAPAVAAERTADLSALIAAVETKRIEHGVAGVGLTLVSTDAVLWSGGLGVKNWDSREPVTADTMFRIGSLTKAFTALALLQLQEQGRLRLEDPLRRHAPAAVYDNPWEATRPITLAHLLEHTAGLQDLTKEEFQHSDPKPLTLTEGLAVRPAARVCQWQPGLHPVYSNPGYGLAGYALEKITGETYEKVIRARLLEPLGMLSSGFFLDPATQQNLATGYAPDGVTPMPYWHMIMRPFGGLNTTPRDMAAFLHLLLDHGRLGQRRIVSAESITRLEQPTTSLAARSGLSFGYGMGIYHYLRRGQVLMGHSGDGDGYLAFFGYSREAGLAYFLAINRFDWSALRALRAPIEDWMVRSLRPMTAAPAAALDESQLARFVGRYELAAWRFPWTPPEELAAATVRVTLDNGVLYTSGNGEGRRALIPVNMRHFRRADEPVATAAFVEDDDGTLYFQEDESWRKVSD